jgi:Zn-dependent peptidase ImmA (M78 family)
LEHYLLNARQWTNQSVIAFAKGRNPFEVISEKVQNIVLKAIEDGWEGPPYEPAFIAEMLKVKIVPIADVLDARIVAEPDGKFRIEYNPNKPNSRIRFSVAHELTHILFPDCHNQTRHRLAHENLRGDIWQLEMLCNFGAAEMLMPVGSFSDLNDQEVTIENFLKMRKEYEVSMEALLIRFSKLTDRNCFVFCASKRDREKISSDNKIDYLILSQSWDGKKYGSAVLPQNTLINDCTAIGYTAKSDENWFEGMGKIHIECVGIPPYPGYGYPRVVGFGIPVKWSHTRTEKIINVTGDATEPHGTDKKIIAQIVNDKASRWGGGFSLVVKKKWHFVQDEFRHWAETNREKFKLGQTHLATIEENVQIMSMIAQHGYGPSPKPRIRYEALKECLLKLGEVAIKENASVHIPRIGAGQAGGSWWVISELIEESLCKKGIKVKVYDLPDKSQNLSFGFSPISKALS